MIRKWLVIVCLAVAPLSSGAVEKNALGKQRFTDATPYGLFFNDYDPNFYVGFVPRVQEQERIKIHVARGNQLRVRMVLSDATLDNFLLDQVAKHDLYKEVIDRGIIQLTSNTAWEAYHARFESEGLREKAARKGSLSPEKWRALNAESIGALNPERLYRIQADFGKLAADWQALLAASQPADDLGTKLDLVNALFPRRMFVFDLDEEQDAAFGELVVLAKAGDAAAFRPKALAFFNSVTDGIYDVEDGRIDYYEYTAIYPAGTYDKTTVHAGRVIPDITTPGIWFFQPRMHGTGMVGMVDYISAAGYYGLIPMFPYEYASGSSYNSIHNTGISNWIQGHALLPKEWAQYTQGSRNGKPFNRMSMTSRGPVSHGCTRLNNGHLAELRELLPSTTQQMEGVVNYRNISHCYDVFDRRGDGDVEIMGVQYYIAYRHTNERVAKEIWAQNNREDFYGWLYAGEMNYGPIGQVTFDDVCEAKFVKRKTLEGKHWQGLTLYEAPYQPETVQFYKIKGVASLSDPGMNFNRELRRVGYGYQVDRKALRLD